MKSSLPRLTLVLLALGSAARAQSGPSTPSNPAPAARETVVELSTFEVSTALDRGYRAGNSVSATRIDTPIKELPFAVSAFTQQFIQDTGSTDLFDLVRYAPGVTSGGKEFTGGKSVFTIRGFDQQPQRNGFVGNTYVDTVAIERVEVVKGPASVLYGQVAPGGTVNYITKRAQEKPFAQLNLTVGSYNLLRTQMDVNQPIAEGKVMARFNGVWQNGMQYIDPTGKASDQMWVVAPTVTWKITPNISLVSDYEWYHRRENVPQMFKMNMNIPGLVNPIDSSDMGFMANVPLGRDFNYGSRNDWRKSDNESVNEQLIMKVGSDWVVRGSFVYQKSRIAHKLTGGGSVNLTVPARYGTGTAAARAFAAEVLANPLVGLTADAATINRRARLEESWGKTVAYQAEATGRYDFDWGTLKPLFGAFYSSNRSQTRQRQVSGLNSTTPGPQGAKTVPFPMWDLLKPATIDYDTDFDPAALPLTTYSQNIGKNTAVYSVLNASLLKGRLQAVAGVRHNRATAYANNIRTGVLRIAENSPKRTAPQLGLGYKVTNDVMLYTSYSEAFVVNNSALQTLNVPVGPAKPTTSRGYEVGVKTDLRDGRISSTVSLFEIENQDRITSFNIIQPNAQVVITTTQGTVDRSRGIEGDLTFSPTDHWQIYVSGALNDVRVTKVPDPSLNIYLGSHPEASAKFLANLWTRYNFTGENLKGYWIGAGANHTGRKAQRLQNPFLFLPSYTLYDLTVGRDWKWRGRPTSVTLAWKNMTNVEYFPANQQRGWPGRVTLDFGIRY